MKTFHMVEEHNKAPRPRHNYQQAYAQPRFQEQQQQRDNRGDYQGQKRTQSFEDQMLHFMLENKRILNLHERKFSDLENFPANTAMFQINTNASLKNLEIQIGQLAQAVQKEPKDSFPSDTRKNPKDCMAVILRSGRELDERRVQKRDTKEEKQVEIGEELEQHSSETTEKEKTIEMQPKQQGMKEEVKAYNPPVPFPQILQKAKLEE